MEYWAICGGDGGVGVGGGGLMGTGVLGGSGVDLLQPVSA